MHYPTRTFGWMGLDLTLFRNADDPVPTGRLTYGRLRQATVHLAVLKGAVAAHLVDGRMPLASSPGVHGHASLAALIGARVQAIVSPHGLAFPSALNPEFETFYRLDAALLVLDELTRGRPRVRALADACARALGEPGAFDPWPTARVKPPHDPPP